MFKKFDVKPSTAELWFKSGYLSFNPVRMVELNDNQVIEFEFVASIFLSGISLDSIHVLLSKLDKPYRYDLRDVFYNFLLNEWEYIEDRSKLTPSYLYG
ncbi:MAG: hypothetical protein HN982_07350 [Candidatus Marinimicrobia bacterium]|jgi:hypothetical protein|nr:hypothetical protein [Candidatus Neomarinimicrobiota bacterium]